MALHDQAATEAPGSRRALTLLELLVVLGIIGLLLAVLLPAIQSVRESARKTSCTNNLRQVGQAVQQYSSSKDGRLPPGWIADDNAGYPGWGWGSLILDQLGYANAKQQMMISSSDDGSPSMKAKPDKPKKAKGKGIGKGKAKGKAANFKDIDDADPDFLVQQISEYLCPSDLDAAGTFPLPEDTATLLRQGMRTLVALDTSNVVRKGAQNQIGSGQKPGGGSGQKGGGAPNKPGQGNKPPNDPGSDNGSSGIERVTVSRSNYAGVYGTGTIDAKPDGGDGAFYENSETLVEKLEQNTTALVGERKSDFMGTWTGAVPGAEFARARVVGEASNAPNSSFGGLADFGSNHDGGASFLFAGGQVKFLHEGIDLKVYQALMSRHAKDKGSIPQDFDRAP